MRLFLLPDLEKRTTHIYEICLCGFDILSYTPSQGPPPEKQAGAISAAMGFDVAHIIPFRKKLVEIAFYCIGFSVSMRGWVTRLPTHLSSRTVCCQHEELHCVFIEHASVRTTYTAHSCIAT